MHDLKKSVKIMNVAVVLSMLFLGIIAVTMPFLVKWYVEVRGRDPRLATSIMITAYPCIPFAFALLINMKKLLNNLKKGLIFGDANLKHLKIITFCCLISAVIMIFGGFRYMPFWVSGLAALAGALIVALFKTVFEAQLNLNREQEFESVRKQFKE